LFHNSEENTYRNEDIVRGDELDGPKGAKLKRLFTHSVKAAPCHDDRMTNDNDDKKRTIHIFYLDVDKMGDADDLGRCYFLLIHT
jgi:hypothetical protein